MLFLGPKLELEDVVGSPMSQLAEAEDVVPCRTVNGNGSSVAARVPLRLAVGPPKPLMTSSDKQAYQRELNTVTIGTSHLSTAANRYQLSALY